MPPRRIKGPNPQIHIDEFRIKFYGPVQPREWPDHLRSNTSQAGHQPHRFDVFREIWGNRYQDFKRENDLTDPRRGDYVERIRDLCNAAYSFRDDVNANEMTWRSRIEDLVLAPFKKGSVW